jgi:hypothetical protein
MDTGMDTGMDNGINNGLITKIWGPALWIAEHSITFGYPINPTASQKASYRLHFETLGDVMPCIYCRNSYIEFISVGDTQLNDAVMENRHTLTHWFWKIHNAVNAKLGVDYGVTYDDLVRKYESFRARCVTNHVDPTIKAIGCVVPLDYKAFSYRNVNSKDCAILSHTLIMPFLLLAKLRNLESRDFEFYNLSLNYSCNVIQMKSLPAWQQRNKFCQRIIQYMRESGIPAIESRGKWKNTPSKCELRLLLMYSTTMSRPEVIRSVNELYANNSYMCAVIGEKIDSI